MKKRLLNVPVITLVLCIVLMTGVFASAETMPVITTDDGVLMGQYTEDVQASVFYAEPDLSGIVDSTGKYNGYKVYTAKEAAEYCIDLMKDHVESISDKFIVAVEYPVSDSGSPYTYASNVFSEEFDEAFNESLFKDGAGGDYLLFSMYGKPFYLTTACRCFENGDTGIALVYATPGKAYYYTTAAQEKQFRQKAETVLSGLNGKSDYEKVCEIFDYVCANVEYDYDNLNNTGYYTMFTAYAALCEGKAVCQGYSNLFYYLCNEAGVPCRIVAGTGTTATGTGAHAWNIVKLDGVWYHVDATWGASYAQWYSGRYFFLQSEANFVNGHNKTSHEMDYMQGIQNINYKSAEFKAAYPISQTNDYCGGHDYVLVDSRAASCGVQGYEVYKCSKCGETYEETYDALKHDFVTESETEPTCTTQGVLVQKCKNCGETRTETTGALGHDYVVKESQEAGCVEPGYTLYECKRCGHERMDDITPSLGGHDYELVEAKEMTHEEDGYELYKCSKCGETCKEVHKSEPEHSWGDEVVVHESETCGEDILVTCGICGETMLEKSDLHEWEKHEAVEATCTSDGCGEYEVCKYCGYVNGDDTVIEATGHTEGATDYTADGCVICAVCGEHYHPEPEDVIVVSEPTCTEDGEIEYVCGKCGMNVTETISALGHEWEAEVTKEATEENCPEITYTCERCGETYTTSGKHTVVEIDEKPATCIDEGHTAGTRCSECGVILTGIEKISPLGHTAGDPEYVAPTCTENGDTGAVHCVVCGEWLSDGEMIEAHGHDVEEEPGYEATCIEPGLTHMYYCGICGETLDEAEEIPLGDHDFTEDVTEATCTENGYDSGIYCTVCGFQETEGYEINATGHDWVTLFEGTPKTCYTDGQNAYVYCANCGEISEDGAIIPAGHELVHYKYKEPTEFEDGNIDCWYCEECDTFFADENAEQMLSFHDVVIHWGDSGDTNGDTNGDTSGDTSGDTGGITINTDNNNTDNTTGGTSGNSTSGNGTSGNNTGNNTGNGTTVGTVKTGDKPVMIYIITIAVCAAFIGRGVKICSKE